MQVCAYYHVWYTASSSFPTFYVSLSKIYNNIACCYHNPDGLAWDWVNEKLYWTDGCDDDIEVFDPKTGYRKVLIQTGPDSNPRGIVLDPTTR